MASEDVGGLESLQVLLQQNPASLTFGRVADALMQKGRIDEAIQICEEGVRRHPQYVTGHMVLGKCYLKKKLFDQAEKEFKRVLLFDPRYIAAHKHYGDLMREIGWDNTCEMSYRKILQIDPLDAGVEQVIDEFARKAKSQRPEPAAPTRPVKKTVEAPLPVASPKPPSTLPITEEDLLTTTGVEESEFLRYQPPSQPADQVEPAKTEETLASEYVAEPGKLPGPPSEVDEERFSYILDDIFQDEVLDEKNARPASPESKASSETGRPLDSTTMLPADLPVNNNFAARQGFEASEHGKAKSDDDQRLFRETASPFSDVAFDSQPGEPEMPPDQPPRPPSKSPAQPFDFDLDFSDEAPPVAPSGPAIDFSSKASAIDQAGAGKGKTEIPPIARSGKPVPPSPPQIRDVPARRTKFFDELTAIEEPPPLPPSGEREKIVTPTLGEIYAAQGQYAKAIGVFELLSKKDPNNRNYRDKIDYLKKRLQETQNAG
jgi:tetratricopeptide (TPR) repeat protein